MATVPMSILKGAIWRDARWTLALRNWGAYAAAAMMRFKALAPYALIELVLPGGSVMALLLWLYRRRKNGVGFGGLRVRVLSLWSTYATTKPPALPGQCLPFATVETLARGGDRPQQPGRRIRASVSPLAPYPNLRNRY
jgi:hypothetical protein